MTHCSCVATAIAVLVILQPQGRTWAENTPVSAQPIANMWSTPWPATTSRLPPVRLPLVDLPTSVGGPSVYASRAPQQTIDGTWSDDGRYIVINLNGQQLRLAKFEPEQPATSIQIRPGGGEIYGRLSHHGQPLVNSEVAIVHLKQTWNGFTVGDATEPLSVTTNGDGVYHFTGVPPGAYKIKWRPAGNEAWIRRIEIRPDVRVRANETSHIKEIRVSLRTIN